MPTVQTNGIDTYYERYGEGPPLIVIHGAVADHRVLAEQFQSLADTYEVIVYDVRGHGKTDGSDRSLYTIELFADDLQALIEVLELDEPVICGHSMGGMLAQTYGLRYPETPSAIITMGAQTPNFQRWQDWLHLRTYATVMYHLTRVFNHDQLSALNDRLSKLLNWDTDVDNQQDVIDRLEAIQTAHGTDVPQVSHGEFRKISYAIRDFFAHQLPLSELTSPALFLYGEREVNIIVRHSNHLAESVPHGIAREIPDAGHLVYVEQPDLLFTEIREFLEHRTVVQGTAD